MLAVNTFSPRDAAEDALRYWWLIALMAVAGGLAGWLFHLTQPPVYEAQAVFFVSIDFSVTGELTQFEEDHAVSVIRDLLISDPVVEAVLAEAGARQIPIDRNSLMYRMHLERRQAFWTLRINDPDPEIAAALVQIWAAETFAALQTAHQAALEAQSLQSYLAFLQGCLGTAPMPVDAQLSCSQFTPQIIPEEIQTINQELQDKLIASQGVFPPLIFDLPQAGEVAEKPVRYGRNTVVMFGCLIGFVLGIWVVNIDLPGYLHRRLRRA